MEIVYDKSQQSRMNGLGRAHPWTVMSKGFGEGRYVDFKQHPEAIATSLEDLRPLKGSSAEVAVIDFLTWANGSDSPFETNDFAMAGPVQSDHDEPGNLVVWGRIAVLFRDLERNIDGDVERLTGLVERHIRHLDPGLRQAKWSWCLWPHDFTALATKRANIRGVVVAFYFSAYGDTLQAVSDNLVRALAALREGLTHVLPEIGPNKAPQP